jgi:glycosyltransferase involved in cell wall biosynthesis
MKQSGVMRILHVIPSMSPARGGPTVALQNMAVALAARGATLDIVTTDDDGQERMQVPRGEAIERGGYRVRFMPRQTRLYTVSLPLASWLAAHVRDYEVVHVHALFSFPSIAACLAAGARHVPYIVRPLGTLSPWGLQHRRASFKRISLALVEGPLLSRAAAVHFTTEQEMREAANLGIDMRGTVVPIGIDTSAFEGGDHTYLVERYPQLLGRRVILFLSRLDRKKGLELLLDAYADTRRSHPEAALVVAGSGEARYVEALHLRAETLGLAGDVIWAGPLHGEAKIGALASADIFVLPSYAENFGIAVVEAMASCLPVIVSQDVALAPEIVAADAGLAVAHDGGALARALRRLLDDREDAARRGENGRRLARARYSLDATSAALLDLYRTVAGQP